MKILYLSQQNEKKEKRFFELLYDERLTEGAFYIPQEQFGQIGGLNRRLKAKRQYELFLRLADAYFVEMEECSEGWEAPAGYVRIQEQEEALDWEGIRTDCYVISKYKDKLMQNSCFNEVVESVLEEAKSLSLQERTVDFLEKMLKREDAYYHIDDAVRSILIYKGEDVCYNVLNVFAEQFGEALERAGQKVEYFDSEEEPNEALTRYIGKRYQAIIGMQTYLFSIKMEDGETYLHDLIHAPLYNFVFDHPIWVRVHLLQSPKKLCVFTLDGSYVKFCKKYFQRNAYLFPPAGCLSEKSGEPKRFAISFVGSCGNYYNELILIHQMERNVRFIANKFLLKMRTQPHLTSDEAFRQALDERGVVYTDEEYMELFFSAGA